ncbi:MAG: hypothetical protein EON93_18400 [Burkholderiales bacterium]|nr:MAG: hypothetical protein EON93_18400 [Burkholderiales bacterium]
MPLPTDAKRFWRALLACGALILAMCLFNAAIDPTGQIGLAKTHALNRALPASLISYTRNSTSVTAYERVIATTSADTFLLGSSREARGFDLCDRPNILRIAGSGWGIREMSQVQAKILEVRKAPATLLIELGVASDPGGASDRPNFSRPYTALSPQTTLLSFQTVLANMRRSDKVASREAECRPLRLGPTNWPDALRRFEFASRMFDDSKASRQRGRAILAQMIDDADRICAKTRVRHTIIYFSLPGTPNERLTQQFDAALKDAQRDLEKMLQELSKDRACRFLYLDLLTNPPGSVDEQRLWRNRDHWKDFTHFSPQLGRLALNAILQPK